jgi:RNA polymerase sigma-70 factor (ECF subfamily)
MERYSPPPDQAPASDEAAAVPESDESLAHAVAAGDRAALGRLYDRYASSLLAIGQRFLQDRREAEDLLHDVFLEVWRLARDYDAARGSVRAWLSLRMRSRALDRLKAPNAARRRLGLDEESPHLASAVDAQPWCPDLPAVRRALAELPDEQRQVLELGYFDGLSSSQIAARVKVPIGTVKSRVAAALAKLRACLGAQP